MSGARCLAVEWEAVVLRLDRFLGLLPLLFDLITLPDRRK
jgi:hypothetical protein